jgi:hypothetical protein
MALWTAIVLAAASRLFVDGFLTPRPAVQWWLAALAVACFGARHSRQSTPLAAIGAGGAAAVACLAAGALALAPAAERPGLWLVVLGAAAQVATRFARVPRLGIAATATLATGSILILFGAVEWAWNAWTARNPELPFATWLLEPILDLFGCDAACSDGVLYVRTLKYTYPLPLTWNHLALGPIAAVAAAGSAALGLDGRARATGRFLAILIAYALLRFGVIFTVFLSRMLFEPHDSVAVHVSVFWLPWVTAASLLPLIPILARYVPAGGEAEIAAARAPAPRLALAGVVASAFGLAIWHHFPDPGETKAGRILIDETRGPWERSDRPYTTDWYGVESGYNYACLADHLDRYGRVDRILEGPITGATLADCDVLVLKTPGAGYEQSEVEAIRAWVESGGGLFVLGEHTNVWGSSRYLNDVLEPFGMRFRYDVVFDVQRRWEELWRPEARGRHPAQQDVPFYLFAVSCSLDLESWLARPVIRARGLWSLPIDYSPSNFYPTVLDRTDATFGTLDQMGARTYGRGRVLAFTDSTTFSNFDVFDPGKPELLLGSFGWLNRRNRFEGWRWAGLALSAAGAAVLLAAARRGIAHAGAPLLIAGAAFAALAGTALCDAGARAFYPSLEPRRSVERLTFDLEHGDYELPIFGFPQQYRRNYETFYIWTQRLGCAPRVTFALEEALKKGDPLVLIRPTRSFAAAEIDAVRAFVADGGNILVLDSGDNDASTANEVLAPFGLALAANAASKDLVNPRDMASITSVRGGSDYQPGLGARTVKGGRALLFTALGEPVAAAATHGRGLVLAAGIGDSFCEPATGGHAAVPDAEKRRLFEVEFTLIRALLSGDATTAVGQLEMTLDHRSF